MEVLARHKDVEILLGHASGRFLEAVEDLRQGDGEDLLRRPARQSVADVIRAAVVPAEEHRASEQGLSEQSLQLVLMALLPALLLGDKRCLVLGLRASLLSAQDLRERNTSTVSRSIASSEAAIQKIDAVSLLAALASVGYSLRRLFRLA